MVSDADWSVTGHTDHTALIGKCSITVTVNYSLSYLSSFVQ